MNFELESLCWGQFPTYEWNRCYSLDFTAVCFYVCVWGFVWDCAAYFVIFRLISTLWCWFYLFVCFWNISEDFNQQKSITIVIGWKINARHTYEKKSKKNRTELKFVIWKNQISTTIFSCGMLAFNRWNVFVSDENSMFI